jgi:hypothetical protein
MLVADMIAQTNDDHTAEGGNNMFERKASIVAATRSHRTRTMAELIDAARPPENLLQSSKGRVWIAEATNRSCNLLQLFLALEVKTWQGNAPSIRSQLDCALAGSLCGSFRSLDHDAGEQAVECSELFQAVVGGIVTLFEKAVGRLTLLLEVDQLSLSADKRRALVLCASELLLTAIRCGFHSRSSGTITVALKATSRSHSKLTVCIADSLIELTEENKSIAIVGGLAGILDGDIILRRSPTGNRFVEIIFPHL